MLLLDLLLLFKREFFLLRFFESLNGEVLKGFGEGFLLEVLEEFLLMFVNLIL